jgi:hypothetical protein
MASFSFFVRVSWKGDAEKGAEMEWIVREAFLEEPVNEKAKALDEELFKNLLGGPEKVEHFGEAPLPRTMDLYWKETRADQERALPVIFRTFPDLQFRMQIVNEDADEYRCSTYKKGKLENESLEETGTYRDADEGEENPMTARLEKAEKELFKWPAFKAFDDVFPYTEALKYIPAKNWKDADFCKNAAGRNGLCLGYAPERLKTEALCKDALAQDLAAVEFVPDDLKKQFFADKEFCVAAVKVHGGNLRYVPEEFITGELCKAAVENGGRKTLKAVPKKFRSEKFAARF